MEPIAPSPRRSYAHAPRLPEQNPCDLRDLFAPANATSRRPVELEIGCARAGFLLERLASEPRICMVGLEIQRKAATLAWEKIEKLGQHERCRVFAEDAREVLPRFQTESVQRVFLHFPDPWWKKRHGKRRLASAEVMSQIARVLQLGGELLIQTDVADLVQAFALAASEEVTLQPRGAAALIQHSPFEAQSPRERQATADGLPIFRLHYRKAAG